MEKIEKLLAEYNKAVDLQYKKRYELDLISDGYKYITNLRCYGANTYTEHNNYATVSLLCDEYYGDNGIVDVWTNNPYYKKENYKSWDEEKEEHYPNIIVTYGDITYLNDEQLEKLETRDVSMGDAICNIMADMIDINKN